jgi:hypothetical protein
MQIRCDITASACGQCLVCFLNEHGQQYRGTKPVPLDNLATQYPALKGYRAASIRKKMVFLFDNYLSTVTLSE